jgi:glycosyltransferase involved in cell wall biosynthesis
VNRPRGIRAVTFVNYPYAADLDRPQALLGRYPVLGGWARAVAAAGGRAVDVSVVQRFSRDAVVREEGVTYHFVADGPPGAAVDRLWAPRLVERVVALGPDVVHLHGLLALPVRQLRARLPRTAAVLAQDHGGAYEAPGFRKWRWRTFNRLGLRAADGFLFSVREQAARWIETGVIGREQPIYELLESGSTLPDTPPAAGGPSRLPGAPALLWVGRLNPNKDPLTILDGFARALPSMPEAALTLVFGAADLLPEVERRIAASPLLSAQVHVAGRVEHHQLPAFYAAADLFLLGSHSESLCFALCEALSFGVTPIVTDIPAFRVLTDGGRVGALFPVGDAAALAQALIRLGATARNRAANRAAVRAHFEATLSWPVLARQALAIYAEVTASRDQFPEGAPPPRGVAGK